MRTAILIISKRITPSRTVSRINDETVTTEGLRPSPDFSWTFMDSMSISLCSMPQNIWKFWIPTPNPGHSS